MRGSIPSFSRTLFHSFAMLGSLIITTESAEACSSCGCTLSSEWDSQGLTSASGFRLDLRYDYLDQSQLRSGTGTVNRSDYPLPAEREIEDDTTNRYTTLSLDYSPTKTWGVNLQLPYIDRTHTTVPEGETEISSSKTTGLGDVRVIGRFQGFNDAHNWGLQLGLKLPTGAIHDTFRDGTAMGELLDRGLQSGTGTTDVLLGVYHFDSLSDNWDYFAQGMLQQPLNSAEHYRIGTAININAGVRYMAYSRVTPQFQINAKMSERDRGEQADSANSGGTLAYFSPGLSVNITPKLSTYGFVQIPLYQDVNGLQLAPRYTASIGLHYSL